jgi:hypothetical protein
MNLTDINDIELYDLKEDLKLLVEVGGAELSIQTALERIQNEIKERA